MKIWAVHDILLLDATPYRVSASLSDAAGLDPKIHTNNPEAVIDRIRTFLATKSGENLPGGKYIVDRYRLFKTLLSKSAASRNISLRELKRLDYLKDLQRLMGEWIVKNPP